MYNHPSGASFVRVTKVEVRHIAPLEKRAKQVDYVGNYDNYFCAVVRSRVAIMAICIVLANINIMGILRRTNRGDHVIHVFSFIRSHFIDPLFQTRVSLHFYSAFICESADKLRPLGISKILNTTLHAMTFDEIIRGENQVFDNAF